MKRVSLSIALGMLALLVLASPALAARSWCSRDPIVRLNGEDVQIWVAIPEEYEPLVTGPVDVKIATPHKVSQELIYLDQGFNGHGETVKFADLNGGRVYKDGSFDVMIRATVPIDREALRRMDEHARDIPFRIIIETNGETVTYDTGVMDVINSEVFMVEQTNDGTQVNFVVTPSK